MPVYSKKPLVQDGNWLHTAYCILHTVESVMEGKRCKGTISASGDETAASQRDGWSFSCIEFRRAGTKRFRLHFPPGDAPDESHCE